MDLLPIFQCLFSGLVNIMESFTWTLGGYTVNLLQFFAWFLFGGFVMKLFLDFLGGQ